MPHSMRDETSPQDHNRRFVMLAAGVKASSHVCSDKQAQRDPTPSTQAGNTTRQQSPMLRAWRDELDPRNLTINEALALGDLAR